MNLIINYGQLYSQLINKIKLIINNDFLEIYKDNLFNFFLSNCIFSKEQLSQAFNLSDIQMNNLILLLKNKQLVKQYNNSEYYLFVVFYEMCKNNPNIDILNSFIKSN